jgi:hypothetical protein
MIASADPTVASVELFSDDARNDAMSEQSNPEGRRAILHEIIFEADTPAGKRFDVALIFFIFLSVVVVMLDSVKGIRQTHGNLLMAVEWIFTIAFTTEYILRLYSVGRPLKYATSFFGLIDLLAILPTYLSVLFPGTQYLVVIRILRVLRIFRVLKLAQFVSEANVMLQALRASGRKITVFFFTIATLVIIFGSVMYLVEGESHGFTSTRYGSRSGHCGGRHGNRFQHHRRAHGHCRFRDVEDNQNSEYAGVPAVQLRRPRLWRQIL